jgi:hypothetical protein
MKGVVKKAFPFALDGITISQLASGTAFPPDGFSINDTTFQGLVDAGFVEATEAKELPAEEEVNRRIIDAIDKRLSASSDEELKGIIARRGIPFSGNMVHAVLVAEAKAQMVAEFEGAEPVPAVDPNSGVTEQPLSAPGQATPPSAAAAVQQQQAQADLAEQQKNAAGEGGDGDGQSVKTNQFGEPMPENEAKSDLKTEAELNDMNKAQLEEYAAEKKIDISGAKTKAEYVEALKPKN